MITSFKTVINGGEYRRAMPASPATPYGLGFAEDSDGIQLNKVHVIGDNGANWGLKISKCFFVQANDCLFEGGTERAYDQVRGGVGEFNRCVFQPGPVARKLVGNRFAPTQLCDVGLKGGVRDVTFTDCTLNDILLGDWTIYDQITRPKTIRIKLVRCKNTQGGPVIVRGRYADPVSVEAGSVAELCWSWLPFDPITKGYWWYNRKHGDDRKNTSPDEFVIAPMEISTSLIPLA